MFNNGLPDSSLFCCISLLCLPHCLPAHMTCTVCYSSFYALCTMSIHCTVPLLFIQLLHFPPSSHMNHLQQQQPQQLQQQQQPHLFSVPCTYSFCAPCACNACNTSAYSHRTNILHLSSALPDHHNSSASLVVPTTRPTSLGVLLRFLSLSGS
jgi:hypothetical protein